MVACAILFTICAHLDWIASLLEWNLFQQSEYDFKAVLVELVKVPGPCNVVFVCAGPDFSTGVEHVLFKVCSLRIEAYVLFIIMHNRCIVEGEKLHKDEVERER